jgi:hypothetical protein
MGSQSKGPFYFASSLQRQHRLDEMIERAPVRVAAGEQGLEKAAARYCREE